MCVFHIAFMIDLLCSEALFVVIGDTKMGANEIIIALWNLSIGRASENQIGTVLSLKWRQIIANCTIAMAAYRMD